jgi:hypothetical protein
MLVLVRGTEFRVQNLMELPRQYPFPHSSRSWKSVSKGAQGMGLKDWGASQDEIDTASNSISPFFDQNKLRRCIYRNILQKACDCFSRATPIDEEYA